MKHTPTPWEIGHQLGDGFSIVHEIAPNCGKLVCLATCHNIGGQAFHGFPLDDATAKANRDFIILAANAHAGLVAKLLETAERCETAARYIRKQVECGAVSQEHSPYLSLEGTADALEAQAASVRVELLKLEGSK